MPANRSVLNNKDRVHNLTKTVIETNIEDEAMNISLIATYLWTWLLRVLSKNKAFTNLTANNLNAF